MSFILDALKKLEREKETREPGVVMVGPVPWGGPDRGRRGRRLALAGAVIVVAVAGALFWLRSGDGPAAAPGTRSGNETPLPPGREPVNRTAAEEPGARPSLPIDRTEGPPAAGPAPPASRDLRLPGAETPPPARAETQPKALDESPSPATTAETTATTSETPDTALSDEPGLAVTAEEIEPPARPVPAPEYRLTAISSRDGRPIALLNDRLVREGDRFGDVRIIRIGESDVEIEVKGKRKTIGF
jgi:hypothetical protein